MTPDRYLVHWLAPMFALAAAPAYATTYLTVVQAQEQLFPGEMLTPMVASLSAEQAKAIEKSSGIKVTDKQLKVWRATSGGWFYLDQVMGKHEFISYSMALNADGDIRGIEILDYRETWGSEIRNPQWRAQFVGKREGATLELGAGIVNISGATLSCKHIADGIRRLLATHAFVSKH